MRISKFFRYLPPTCCLLLSVITGCGMREGQTVKRGGVQQDVSFVASGNQKMNQAMAQARQTVPRFVTALTRPQPGQTGFMVKMKVTDGQVTEYMWLKNLSYDGARFHGQLMDDPYEVKGYHIGQDVSVAPSEISDWMFNDDGAAQGAFTQKVLDEMEHARNGS